jgi:hypothetical protein
LSLVFDNARFSIPLIQALLDKMCNEVEKKDVVLATIRTDISHSALLKILQKNGFKLTEVEKTDAQDKTCMGLSRHFKKGLDHKADSIDHAPVSMAAGVIKL